MGALTLKPSAYTFRPWEVSSKGVPDLFDFTSTGLSFGMRGDRVIRINKPDWLRDRIRFSYDGFRRQRLTRTYHNGVGCGLAATVASWWGLFINSKAVVYLAPDGCTALGVLPLLIRRFSQVNGAAAICVYNLNRVGACFYGPFGLGAAAYGLAMPVQLDYEGLGLFSPPQGVPTLVSTLMATVQVVSPTGYSCVVVGYPKLAGLFNGYRVSRSVLQVSPLQRLLSDVAD